MQFVERFIRHILNRSIKLLSWICFSVFTGGIVGVIGAIFAKALNMSIDFRMENKYILLSSHHLNIVYHHNNTKAHTSLYLSFSLNLKFHILSHHYIYHINRIIFSSFLTSPLIYSKFHLS